MEQEKLVVRTLGTICHVLSQMVAPKSPLQATLSTTLQELGEKEIEMQAETGTIECVVFYRNNELYFDCAKSGDRMGVKLSHAVNSPTFVGYKYEDGVLSSMPRDGFSLAKPGKKARIPTHVLFKKTK